jgi:hypothetical protein
MNVSAPAQAPTPPSRNAGSIPSAAATSGQAQGGFADMLRTPAGGSIVQDGSTAQVFNENGFFGHAIDAAGAGGSQAAAFAPRHLSGTLKIPSQAGDPPQMSLPATSFAAPTDRPPERISSQVQGSGPAGRPLAAMAIAAPQVQVPVTADAAVGELPDAARTESSAAAHRSTPSRAGCASDTSATLQFSQDGVAVVVRAERLSREEKLRLRTAIAELLGRHGLGARDIILNGEQRPVRAATGDSTCR